MRIKLVILKALIIFSFLPMSSLSQTDIACAVTGGYQFDEFTIIPEKDHDFKTKRVDGSIVTRVSHNLHMERKLKNMMNIDVNIEWFDDNIYQPGGNARATNRISERDKSHGTILLGVLMLKNTKYEVYEYIIMHEAAHIYEFKERTPYGPQELPGKHSELFADFIAGFILGMDHGELFINDIDLALFTGKNANWILKRKEKRKKQFYKVVNKFYSIGDTNFFHPEHHGTHEERARAVAKGYALAISNVESLYRHVESEREGGATDRMIKKSIFDEADYLFADFEDGKLADFQPRMYSLKRHYIDWKDVKPRY